MQPTPADLDPTVWPPREVRTVCATYLGLAELARVPAEAAEPEAVAWAVGELAGALGAEALAEQVLEFSEMVVRTGLAIPV